MKHDLDAIKDRVSCADVLRQHGIDWQGKDISCPLPGHDDQNPSFGLCHDNHAFVCHGCNRKGDVIELEAMFHGGDRGKAIQVLAKLAGIEPTRTPRYRSRIVESYEYTDTTGSLLFQVCRVHPKDFRQRRRAREEELKADRALHPQTGCPMNKRNGQPLRPDRDGWIWSIEGLERVLYRLPATVEALTAGRVIFVAEGEKAVTALVSLDLAATCSNGGALKWTEQHADTLKGAKQVIVLPDNDEKGRKHAALVLRTLTGKVESVRVIELPNLPHKGDAFDWIAAGGTREKLKAVIRNAPDWTPPADKPEPRPVTSSTTAASGDCADIRARLWEIGQAKLGATETYRQSAAAVLKWLHARGRFYHHVERRDFAGVMFFDSERKLLLPVQGDAFLAWLADALAVNRAERLFAFVSAAVETEGLSERAKGIEPATYWAGRPGVFYLSNGPGSVARVSADAVAMVDNGTDGVLFPYGATLDPWALTEPADPFETCALFRDMSTTAPHGRLLFKLWACSLPSDQRTKPPLSVSGVIGSGKTKAVTGLFELYGMPARVSAIHKNGEGDFWVAMEAGGLTCFDNADTRIDWLADALAAAATGGTMEKRKLYKDLDRVTLRARSWVAVTAASPSFAADAGLADRLLVVRLARRNGETAEAALSDEIKRNRDAGLSWVCETLSMALADTKAVPSGLNARHPDFAALAVRIGRAIGQEAEALAVLRAAEADKGLFNIENDWIGALLLDVLQEPFTGTAGDLLDALKEADPTLDGKLSAKRLGKRLSKLWPHLQAVFHAEQETDRTRARRYTFQPPSADFAEFQTAFSEKSHVRDNIESFAESPSETLQSLHPDPLDSHNEQGALPC